MEEQPVKKVPVVLSPRQIAEVFERIDSGRYNHKEVAEWFGCSEQLISKLVRQREEGRDRSKEVAAPVPDKRDSWSVQVTESCLGAIAVKVESILEKVPNNVDALPVLTRTMKTLLDSRRQLKELPKDLRAAAANVDEGSLDELVELVPEENRERFLKILKGLAQARGQPSPDLAGGDATE